MKIVISKLLINNYKLLIALIFLILFFAIHLTLQKSPVYNATFGKFVQNYKNTDGEISLVNKPYEKITNKNLLNWDAAIYHNIKDNLYNLKKAGGDYIFASFPLFSLIWRISMLPPIGIIILNYIFFILSLIIISYLFKEPNRSKLENFGLFTIGLSFPTVVVFLIPYSEATFMLMITIAILGLFKGKYILFFIGILGAAMTRSAILIIFLVFLFTDILFLIKHRSFKFFLIEFLKKILPLFIGTLIALLIQYSYGSGSLFKFIEVQKYWGYSLAIPHNIRDWSLESFGVSIAAITFIILPVLLYILLKTYKHYKEKKSAPKTIFKKNKNIISEYLFHLSIIYFLGMFFFILLFRGGSLYGIPRYIIGSPFFYVFLFIAASKINLISGKIRIYIFGILTLLSFFFMIIIPYSSNWNFYDTGYLLFVFAIGLLTFYEYIPKVVYSILLLVFFSISTLWATYLFNMLLSNAWFCV